MDDRRAADKGVEEAEHEIDRMVGGKNAEIGGAGPQRIERGERRALFQIIFVRHHTAFGTPARARRVDDGCDVAALAGNEDGLALSVEAFPALRPIEVGARRRLRYE